MYETFFARYLTFDVFGRYTGTGIAEIEVETPDLSSAAGLDATYYTATQAVLSEPDLTSGSQVAVTALTRAKADGMVG